MLPPAFSHFHVGHPAHPSNQMTYRPQIPPPSNYHSREMGFRPPFPPQDELRNPNLKHVSAITPTQIKFKVLYKTKLCLKFLNGGTCSYGSTCTFAHGAEDLREPPPALRNNFNAQGDEHNLNQSSDQEMQRVNRVKIKCKMFYNKLPCLYGDRCAFLHHDPDIVLRNPNPVQAGMDVKKVNHPEEFGRPGTILKASLQRTKLCMNWEKMKECKYGERCQYAHGVSELQKYDGNGSVFSIDRRDNPLPQQSSKRQTLADKQELQPLKKPRLIHSSKLPRKIDGIYGDWIDD